MRPRDKRITPDDLSSLFIGLPDFTFLVPVVAGLAAVGAISNVQKIH